MTTRRLSSVRAFSHSRLRQLLPLVLALFLALRSAHGYMVESAEDLAKLPSYADVIFKGTVVLDSATGETLVEPAWHSSNMCPVLETKFKVVSVIKGSPEEGAVSDSTVRFRHYGPRAVGVDDFGNWHPQSYRFETGRTYIVFAKKSESHPGVLRQFWESHRTMEDQGVLLCADAQPVTSADIKEVYWVELTRLLKSINSEDALYAFKHLEEMSKTEGFSSFRTTADFSRARVLAAYRPLLTSPNAAIAKGAILAAGSGNPYLDNRSAECWLGSVGVHDTGWVHMDTKAVNPGAQALGKELIAIASGKADNAIRALAIRALGRWGDTSLRQPLDGWLADPAPEVRSAAIILLSDFPGEDAKRHLRALAKDADSGVRAAVALGIGYSRQAELADQLALLLADKDKEVRRLASLSLLSFSPKDEAVARTLKANLENREFAPLFLNALAQESPEPYLNALAQAVKQKQQPLNFAGGRIPAVVSWEILLNYLKNQPPERVQSGKLDSLLHALENGEPTGSDTYCRVYALYLYMKMPERARRFREWATKETHYDIGQFLDRVDKDPVEYLWRR